MAEHLLYLHFIDFQSDEAILIYLGLLVFFKGDFGVNFDQNQMKYPDNNNIYFILPPIKDRNTGALITTLLVTTGPTDRR